MTDNVLKPCPFCGGEAHRDRHDIFCDCGAKIGIPLYVSSFTSFGSLPTYEEAVQIMVEAWNDRADDNLINQQKAEIERLQKRLEEEKHALFEQQAYTAKLQAENDEFREIIFTDRSEAIKMLKAEAIKEFAEKLKEKRYWCIMGDIEEYGVSVADIDNLVKEMTEGEMKAWLVRERDCDFATVVFAETRGKARSIAMHTDACADADFCDIEVTRKPQLDKYYTSGKKEMDWYDDADRIALVKDGGFYCSYEYGCEFEECPAHQWCDRYEEEKEAENDMAEYIEKMKEGE